MIRSSIFVILLGSATVSCRQSYQPDTSTTRSPKGTEVFQPDSASIAQSYKIPDWFRDGKFGIFIHWGPASVPAYDGWYARNMYDKNSQTHKYHEETYGPVTSFGFKDFIPMFKAEKFNPESWAKLFKEAGATYVIPVAEHHDGFALYNSTFNPWNSVKMGPGQDLIKALRGAILNEGLHFGLSSHRAENCWFFNEGMKIPSDVQDSTLSLYGERIQAPDGPAFSTQINKYPGSTEQSRRDWLTHMYEIIDQYEPELLYFDWTVGKQPFQETFYKFMAYYYNNALDWNKQVVVNTKFGYGDNIQVFDIERGKSDQIRKYPWQTDTSIGKVFWFYQKDETDLKSTNHLIDDLVDIVSKNGNMLLNVGPRADGTIPESQQKILREIGHWLQINGEAIYGSRPWYIAGEGINKGTAGYMTDSQQGDYTPQDIRFTTKGDVLYAISLTWPNEPLLITSLPKGTSHFTPIKSVSMLGYNKPLTWSQTEEGLIVEFPKTMPVDYAHVLKIE